MVKSRNKSDAVQNPLFSEKAPSGIRQNPRITLKPLNNIYLRLIEPRTNLRLANISIGGVGFFLTGLPGLASDSKIVADLVVNSIEFRITLCVRHLDSEIAGCSFENPTPQLQQAITDYFKIELNALKMTCVGKKSQNQDGEDILFFHGKNNCEILVRMTKETVTSFNLNFFGNFFESENGKISLIAEKVNPALKSIDKRVSFFKAVESVDQGTVDGVIKLVENIENLTLSQKESILLGFRNLLKEAR